ncbi:hypothetical protein LXL04_033581 [Taraxacum kok-saghyz]
MPAQSSSPANTVAYVDDLLTEILLRLPVRSLLRCKSVSKHWYFLITIPNFKLLRSRNRDPPSGMVVSNQTNKPYVYDYELFSFDINNPVKALSQPRTLIQMLRELMVCSSHSSDVIEEDMFVPPNQYYVYNSTINQFVTLPRTENYDNLGRSRMTIAFYPSKSSHYRIIYVCYLTGEGGVEVEGKAVLCEQRDEQEYRRNRRNRHRHRNRHREEGFGSVPVRDYWGFAGPEPIGTGTGTGIGTKWPKAHPGTGTGTGLVPTVRYSVLHFALFRFRFQPRFGPVRSGSGLMLIPSIYR